MFTMPSPLIDRVAAHLRPELPQLRALVGRYSKLGDNAFYKLYLPVDETVRIALDAPSKVDM